MKKRHIYRSIGVLSGNRRYGYYCEICHKEINSVLHFKKAHPEIYERGMEIERIRY